VAEFGNLNAQRHTNGIINRTELVTCTSRLKTITSRYTYLGIVISAVLGARSDVGTLVVMQLMGRLAHVDTSSYSMLRCSSRKFARRTEYASS
jgi:hypothetical protein